MASGQVVLNVCRKCRFVFKCAVERLQIPSVGIRYPWKSLFVISAGFGIHEAKGKFELQGDHYKPENYRSVSCTSIPCKILEHIIISTVVDCHYCEEDTLPRATRLLKKADRVKHSQLTYWDLLMSCLLLEGRCQKDLLVLDFSKAFDKFADKENRRHEYVLKAASANAADSATTLFSQTAFAMVETEQRYRHMMTTLMQVLDLHVTLLQHGTDDEVERMLGIIAKARDKIRAYQKHIKDLDKLLLSVQKLTRMSAEVAFQAGSEASSKHLNEHVQITRHIANAYREREKMEAQVRKAIINCSQAITKYEEKKRTEQKKKAEDSVLDGDVFEEREEKQENRVDEQRHETAPKEERAKENMKIYFNV